MAPIGDIDGDGVHDIAVQSKFDDSNSGSIFVLFLQSGGTVKAF